MKIKTFGYKKNGESYLGLLEEEWSKMGHEVFCNDDTEDYDVIFNIDRSQLQAAYEESVEKRKPLYCLILDLSYGFFNGVFKIYDSDIVLEEKKIYEHCDSLMVISEETGRVLEKYTGLISKHVGIPALSHERFYEDRVREPYIYFFGRPLDPIKNISTVIQALDGSEFELYISGEVCPPELFKSIAPNIKIKNFGWLKREEVNTLVKHAHLLVAPELYGGLGMQPIEGALMGTPCLSADIPIKREVWGEVLPLYNPHDPEDCRKKITEFNHESINMKEAQEIAEWYLPNRVAERILNSI